MYGKRQAKHLFDYMFHLITLLSFCFFLLSNGSVVPSILIKIDAEAQIDQRQLVAFMNTTLKSGALGKYQVDPSSVQSTGTPAFFVCLFVISRCILVFFLRCFHYFDFNLTT